MLYELLYPLADSQQFFNLFKYITFRSGGALLTSLIISFILGPRIIRWLKRRQGYGQPIREDGPESHLLTKKGTPTMGGIMILLSVSMSTLLWADLSNSYVWIVMFVTAGYGLIGFLDDYLKVSKRNAKGLPGKLKLVGQFGIAGLAGWWCMQIMPEAMATHLSVPFFKDFFPDLGWFYLPFVMLVMVGASNAVNLTDGLDGLAIVPIMMAAGCFAIIAYIIGNAIFAGYLQIHHVPGTGELAVFCGALIGAGLGFLWFNAPPAMVFMGDTGSLSFGGSIGAISVITKHELVLAIIGGLFVLEAVSVIVQVASFKMTGKRVFKMAPIHHHFEKMGWAEPTVVIRFWIIAAVLALLGLATLKYGNVMGQALVYQGKKVGVFGLGKAGGAAALRLLAEGAEVYVADDSAASVAALTAHPMLHRDAWQSWPFAAFDALVLSPGVPFTYPAPHPIVVAAQAAGCPVIGEVEVLSRLCPDVSLIGITGTNGKSTTTALVGHILQQTGQPVEVGGNLGVPALALPSVGEGGSYVLELSSYQLDLMQQVRVAIACLLNITPDHLDRHGGMDGYVAAKQRIFAQQRRGDVAVIGVDDVQTRDIADDLAAGGISDVVRVSVTGTPADIVVTPAGELQDKRRDVVMDLRAFARLPGAHNWQNLACAYAVCAAYGLSLEAIEAAMASFAGLPHRLELVVEKGGVRFVNDSKATNAESTLRALLAYPEQVYWIVGGRAKAGGITSLLSHLGGIEKAYLIGEADAEFAETLEGQVPYMRCGSLEVAVRAAGQDALQAGCGVVLLSPAAASFDQWPNFEVRGAAFGQYVQQYFCSTHETEQAVL